MYVCAIMFLNFIFNYVCMCHYVGCKYSTDVSGKQVTDAVEPGIIGGCKLLPRPM